MSKVKIEENLKTINDLYWNPWIGESFSNSTDKLLIVGESHYADPKNNESIEKHKNVDFTKKVVSELAIKYLTTDKRSGTLFRNLNLALIGQDSLKMEIRDEKWNEFAFYNFIQEPMLSIKKRPSKIQVQQGWKVFIELLPKSRRLINK